MARRKTRKKQRSLRGWIALVSTIGGLIALGLNYYKDFVVLSAGDKTRIFAEFAKLDVDQGSFLRMRESSPPPMRKPEREPWRTIVKVADGDTVTLSDGQNVRLIGIDTPESGDNQKLLRDIGRMGGKATKGELIALGKEAGSFTRGLANGKRCWLEYEREKNDQYGRLLAYVHLEDGTVLNEAILAAGYARVYAPQRIKYYKRYVYLQTEARIRQRGFWAGESPAAPSR